MAQSFNTNLGSAAANYIQQLGIPVTGRTIQKNITQNPYYPSLYSLSNTFDKYQIENAAFKIDEQQLMEMPTPFIAFTNTVLLNSDWVVVTKIDGDKLTYTTNGKKSKTVSKADFILGWKNVVFAANADEKCGDPDYAITLKAEKLQQNKKLALAFAASAILIVLIANFISASKNVLAASSIILLNLAGLFVTTLLLIYDIDKTNTFVKNICTAGNKTNCDAVLNSKASKIFGISWSEAGWFYFAGTTLFLLFPFGEFSNKLSFIAIAYTISATYIPFSIYYQYKVIKQWCPLCLVTQVVLLLQLLWAVIFFWQTTSYILNLQYFIFFILCLFLPVIIWYTLKPILLKAKQAPEFEAAHKRLLYNPDIFNGLLQQQKSAPDG